MKTTCKAATLLAATLIVFGSLADGDGIGDVSDKNPGAASAAIHPVLSAPLSVTTTVGQHLVIGVAA